MDRRTGRTTRIIDEVIQRLFCGLKVFVYDHHSNIESRKIIFEKILNRLQSEHGLQNMIQDKTIVINKQELSIQIKNI